MVKYQVNAPKQSKNKQTIQKMRHNFFDWHQLPQNRETGKTIKIYFFLLLSKNDKILPDFKNIELNEQPLNIVTHREKSLTLFLTVGKCPNIT